MFMLLENDVVQEKTQQDKANDWMKSTVNNDVGGIHLIQGMWLVRVAVRISECVIE